MSPPDVTAKTRQGVLSLLGRQLVTFPISFLSGIMLARILGPTAFGTYASVSFAVMGVSVLLDVGLGAIVIQQAEEPTPQQLKSIFTAQLVVFGGAMAILVVAAHWFAGLFHLPVEGAALLRAMAFNMVIGTLGTNSTLLLERHLQFGVFAKMDVATVILDRAVTLTLAVLGFGAWSFVAGSLVSMTARVLMLFKAAPWEVGLAFDRAVLSRAFRFGAFFQATNLTSLARDNMSTLLGGPLFGPRQVGYLTWGLSLSQTVSHPLVQILARVCFPAFARLADAPEEREKLLVDSLYWLNLISYPILMLLAAHGNPIVRHVFGEAWRPALWALDAFCFRMMGTNVTSMLVGYLNATGRSSTGFRVAAVWTVLEWALAIGFSAWLGFNGIALAYAVGVLIPVAWLLAIVGREANLQLPRTFGLPLLIGALGVAVALGLQPFVKTIWTFVPVLAVSVVVPFGAIALLERRRLVSMLRSRLGT